MKQNKTGFLICLASLLALSVPLHADSMSAKELSSRLRSDEPRALPEALSFMASRAQSADAWVMQAKDENEVDLWADSINAAYRYIKRPNPIDAQSLRAAYVLFRRFGTAENNVTLREEAQRIQRGDCKRYLVLWHSFVGQKGQRVIELYRIYIHDTRPLFSSNWRVCDAAAWELQKLVRRDFGIQNPAQPQSFKERNRAVKNAQLWLAKNKPEFAP